MFRKIRGLYYSAIHGIENLIKWLPIIWNDREFHHHYFHIIMRQKLIHMQKHFNSKHCYSANGKADALNMDKAIKLLNRIIEGEYLAEALKPFDEAFPDYSWDIKTEPCEDNPKLRKVIDTDTPEQHKLLHECYEASDKMEQDDLDELYILLRKHIEEWWD